MIEIVIMPRLRTGATASPLTAYAPKGAASSLQAGPADIDEQFGKEKTVPGSVPQMIVGIDDRLLLERQPGWVR
jgi:hypothetical protein